MVKGAPKVMRLLALKLIVIDEDVVAEAANAGERLTPVRIAKAIKPKITFIGAFS